MKHSSIETIYKLILINAAILRCKFIKLDKFEENFAENMPLLGTNIQDSTVGTLNFHFLIPYFFECGASFSLSKIDINV